MSLWQNNKYKDQQPDETIHHIRGLLKEVGLMPIEKNWKNSAEGFHSVTLSIPKTSLRTNGKGTNYHYALASAYGEMMERLQNLAPFRLGMDFRDEVFRGKRFVYAPDESYIDKKDFMTEDNEWMKIEFKGTKKDMDTLSDLWQEISYEKVGEGYIGLPFVNLMTKKVSHIPVKMLNKIYMSNGMCAGNTRDEALIQGISEVLERHANKEIVVNNLSVPTIPRQYIFQYPQLFSMIKQIESNGKFKIIVKDCSLGQGYPVVAVIFIDQLTHKYFVKFGAFPKFDVAVERTLTELLQGQDIRKMKGLTSFSYKRKNEDPRANMMGIFVNGIGEYPREFFMEEGTADLELWKRFSGDDSGNLLRQVLRLLQEKGYNVFARDVSFLGFPSYQVLVPGFSEVEDGDDTQSLVKYVRYNRIKGHLRRIYELTDREIRELVSLLSDKEFTPVIPVTNMINLQLNRPLPWYLTSLGLLKLGLQCRLKNYQGAVEALDDYISFTSNGMEIPPYYQCLRQYLMMKEEGLEDHKIYNLLEEFYETKVIDKICVEFDPDYIFGANQKLMTCFNCEECKGRDYCSYVTTENVYNRLMDCYGRHPINQLESFKDL